MNLDNTLQKLLASINLLTVITNKYTLKGILLGGSRLLGLETTQSDYDLNIIIEDSELQNWNFYTKGLTFPPIYFKIDDKIVHWYYTSDQTLPNYDLHYRDFWVIESHFAYNQLNKQPLMCSDPVSFYKFKTLLQVEFPEALKRCKEKYLNKISAFLQEFNSNITIRLDKDIYHLVLISNLLQKNKLDKPKLLKIKEYSRYNENRKSWDPAVVIDPIIINFINYSLYWLLSYFQSF